MSQSGEASHLIGHVKDAEHFEVPRFLGGADGRIDIPQFRNSHDSIVPMPDLGPMNGMLEPLNLRITKFMVLELLAALVLIVVFVWLASRLKSGKAPQGRLWNLLESFLIYLRDHVGRPAIGKKDADRFMPFLWTVFFFVLACNLMGLLPWLGSPTGALATTAAMALATLGAVVGSGIAKLGFVGFWKSQVPHMDLPGILGVVLKPMIFLIEVLGLLIKHFVLAVRLLANMMAGHLVLAVIVSFIALAWGHAAIWAVAPASILGATALSLLELLVAFLQAYIFTFLSALFIGMAVHPH